MERSRRPSCAAIQRLDARPDGWRRCALAFLEAQCWTEALRPWDGTVPAAPEESATWTGKESWPGRVVPAALPASRSPRRWIGPALAAGMALAAFSAGWLGHAVRDEGAARHTVAPAPQEQVKTDERAPARITPADAPTEPLRPGSIAGLPTERLPTVREVARLRFGGRDGTIAEVPILAGPGINPLWLMEQPPPVSEQEQALLRRQGYELDQQRRLVTVPLADGRRAAVPVDRVRVRYVGQVSL